MINIEDISLSDVKTTLKKFGSSVKCVVPRKQSKHSGDSRDEFKHSDSKPRSSEERTNTAVMKSNEANNVRLVAEINRSAEIESVYEKLLPEYTAYINPELKDLTHASADVVSASYKGKPVEIKCKVLDDGNKQQEIKFHDGSQISYVSFPKGDTIKINEEEFEIPVGTIIETKSANGRVFSQLIQIPNMKVKVINKPEYLDTAEKLITESINNSFGNMTLAGQAQSENFLSLTKNSNLFNLSNDIEV